MRRPWLGGRLQQYPQLAALLDRFPRPAPMAVHPVPLTGPAARPLGAAVHPAAALGRRRCPARQPGPPAPRPAARRAVHQQPVPGLVAGLRHLPPAATVRGDDAAELRAKLPELEVALATAQAAAASALLGVQAPHAES
jgi:hypothetical protein